MEQEITCTVAHVCQKAEVSAENGELSVIKIVSALHVSLTPEELVDIGKSPKGINTPLDIVLVWDREIEEEFPSNDILIACTIELVDPHGVTIMEASQFDVQIPKGVERYYSIFSFPQGVEVSMPGKHSFEISYSLKDRAKDISKCSVPLAIVMTSKDKELGKK